MHAGDIPPYWQEARRYLASTDPAFKDLIATYPDTLTCRGSGFFTLSRAIVGQQISVKAAQSVWNKVEAACGGAVLPEALLKLKEDDLRLCGLSRQKIAYLQGIAARAAAGNLESHHFTAMEDEDIIHELVTLKGVGRWTAEMFLIFALLRPDVWPVDDLGLLRGLEKNFNGGNPLTKQEAQEMGEKWRPFRTVTTWYLWRSLDPVPVEY